jgi:hypothetical protein
LEVYNLERYINSFVGGLKCPVSGEITVREMESTIQKISQHCANIVNVMVRIRASLVLDCGSMLLTCRAYPPQLGDPQT